MIKARRIGIANDLAVAVDAQLPHPTAISLAGKLDSLFVIVERVTGCNLAGGRRASTGRPSDVSARSPLVCFFSN